MHAFAPPIIHGFWIKSPDLEEYVGQSGLISGLLLKIWNKNMGKKTGYIAVGNSSYLYYCRKSKDQKKRHQMSETFRVGAETFRPY